MSLLKASLKSHYLRQFFYLFILFYLIVFGFWGLSSHFVVRLTYTNTAISLPFTMTSPHPFSLKDIMIFYPETVLKQNQKSTEIYVFRSLEARSSRSRQQLIGCPSDSDALW